MFITILLRERKEEIEPRDAPSATPTATNKAPAAKRSLSPLSILIPSMSASVLLEQPPATITTTASQPAPVAPPHNNHTVTTNGDHGSVPFEPQQDPPTTATTEDSNNGYPQHVFTDPFSEVEYPPNAFLSPPPVPPTFDPRFHYGNGREEFHHTRQGSDPARGGISPYHHHYYPPPHPAYIEAMRYQYPNSQLTPSPLQVPVPQQPTNSSPPPLATSPRTGNGSSMAPTPYWLVLRTSQRPLRRRRRRIIIYLLI
eukprot:sb/3468581/